MIKFVVDPSKCTLDKSCIDVCPTDAFRDTGDTLLISLPQCIGCAACKNICPVKAILKETDASEEIIKINKTANSYPNAERK